MPQIERTILVPYSCQQMFDLVNDIEAYPQFVPGCSGARVLDQQGARIDAELHISKAGIKQSFATRNTLHEAHRVDLELLSGPFKSLQGAWHFEALDGDACKVTLRLNFEFSSKMLQFAFGKVFNEVNRRMVDAFAQRARVVYG
ncbi:type II toxin-antitoxin system RatA family toxin [Aliidiomarina maris]|uniref:Ribosome-associated toxin RatA of RatAB toxin-antitoxin module n=1 Tax=Aliidiomarina maris TaxID=531312 RepID=A0A327WWK8_9GAMM|nr:type II toxin-antitoxin system RatA family toxin [Aliidiomarina maris]MBA3987774.1 ubiquinone-binding protein [Idiomarina sp.]MCL5050440.1 type II toxin-antitoxin system RatA family toxin [Bacillota bacterium]RAJ93670.1 ribosome-associated toxin RatA of RatAB toxin-antitoxin module [Aliidiomarina maris]RUO19387.1 ubiquinone-binding protein [Aliidiomarina maris]